MGKVNSATAFNLFANGNAWILTQVLVNPVRTVWGVSSNRQQPWCPTKGTGSLTSSWGWAQDSLHLACAGFIVILVYLRTELSFMICTSENADVQWNLPKKSGADLWDSGWPKLFWNCGREFNLRLNGCYLQIFLLYLLNFTASFGFHMRRIFWFKSLDFHSSYMDMDLRQQMHKIMLKTPHSHVELTVPYLVALFYLIKVILSQKNFLFLLCPS